MNKKALADIHQFIEENPTHLSHCQSNQDCIKLWQRFITQIPKETKLPGFPIWGMEFGATYPFESHIQQNFSVNDLAELKGILDVV